MKWSAPSHRCVHLSTHSTSLHWAPTVGGTPRRGGGGTGPCPAGEIHVTILDYADGGIGQEEADMVELIYCLKRSVLEDSLWVWKDVVLGPKRKHLTVSLDFSWQVLEKVGECKCLQHKFLDDWTRKGDTDIWGKTLNFWHYVRKSNYSFWRAVSWFCVRDSMLGCKNISTVPPHGPTAFTEHPLMPRRYLGDSWQAESLITETQGAPCCDRTTWNTGSFSWVHLGTFFTLIIPAKEYKTSSGHAGSMSVNS